MSSSSEDCIFCNKTNCKVISSTQHFFVIRDTAYPVTKHHTLIITNRHIDDFFRAEIRISLMLSPFFMSGTPGIIFKFNVEFDIVFYNTLACDNSTHRSRSVMILLKKRFKDF